MAIEPLDDADYEDDEIAAIRAVRHRISAQFGHDPYKLVAYCIELEQADKEGTYIPAPDEPQPGASDT
ncbi:MAG TPA: hypothetical protein VFS20_30975 [Longimicrobium sp.]|nr:hypothetical protein [Longimicrobium sp.]